MSLKKVIRKFHLVLGLTSGLLIFIVSITGCLYVFQEEIFQTTHKKMVEVVPRKTGCLSLTELWASAQRSLGSRNPVNSAGIYTDPSKSWSFSSIDINPKGSTYFSYYKNFQTVYINPYTGQCTGRINYKFEFFNIIKSIHQSMLLANNAGHQLVGWATLCFVFMALTGLALWWPGNRRALRQRLTIRRNTRWRRFNYDLHYVPGFYALLFSLVIAVTGLMWSFSWANKTIRWFATGNTERRFILPPPSSQGFAVTGVLDIALHETKTRFPHAGSYTTSGIPGDPRGAIWVGVRMSRNSYSQTNSLYFDRYSGKLLAADFYRNHSLGERLLSMQYDFHVGSIGGIPTKILACIVSLVCASLPITGLLILIGRRNKRRHGVRLTPG